MERVGVFAALRWECRPVLRQMHQVSRQRLGGFTVWRGAGVQSEIWLIQTGPGLHRARTAASVLCDAARFDLFLSTGCAGALSAALTPGDLVVATSVIGNSSGERFETDADQRERARQAAEVAALRPQLGPVLSSPHVLATAAAKRDAGAQSGAVAVEMEGAAIGACAAQARIPFASVRAILDRMDTELVATPPFVDQETGALRPLALAAYVAAHPGALPHLLGLQRMMKAAQQSLDGFFTVLLRRQ